jgi:hypothetical protein
VAELYIFNIHAGGVGARFFEHFGGHIHTDDMTALADLFGRQEAVQAAAGAEIEHALPVLQGRQGDRVTTAQAEAGNIVWYSVEQVISVDNVLRVAAG